MKYKYEWRKDVVDWWNYILPTEWFQVSRTFWNREWLFWTIERRIK